jgi:hypothetical protein
MQITLRNLRKTADPQVRSGCDDENHPAQGATAFYATNETREAAQDGEHDEVKQNLSSGATAQDAQSETQCGSNNGYQGPLTIVPPKPEHAEQDKAEKSGSPDFAALRRKYAIKLADSRANTAPTAAANDKPPAPVRINGRPIDRSAHYMDPGKGGKGRRKR